MNLEVSSLFESKFQFNFPAAYHDLKLNITSKSDLILKKKKYLNPKGIYLNHIPTQANRESAKKEAGLQITTAPPRISVKLA